MDVRPPGVAPSELVALYEKGALSHKEYRASIDWATRPPSRRRWTTYLREWFLLFGCLLIAAGVIFFGAYNWSALHRWQKFGMLELLLVGFWSLGRMRGFENRDGKALLSVTSLLVGALLAVMGQVYQSGADSSTLFWIWAGLILPWCFCGRSNLLWLIELVIFNVALFLSCFHQGFDDNWPYFTLVYALCNLLPLLLWERQRRQHSWMNAALADLMRFNMLLPLLFSSTTALWEGQEYLICLALTVALLVGLYRQARDRISSMAILAFSTIWLLTSLLIRLVMELEFFGYLLIAVGLLVQIALASGWLKMLQREYRPASAPDSQDLESARTAPKTVLAELSEAGLLDPQAGHQLRNHAGGTPWYVSALTGCGAWLASWFLLAFVVAAINEQGPLMGLVGAMLLIASTLLRRLDKAESEFRRYATLSVHLAGHLLIVGGYAAETAWDLDAISALVFGLQWVTLLFYRDDLARFLAAFAAVVSASVLSYELFKNGGLAFCLWLVALIIVRLLLGQRSWLLSRWAYSHGPVVLGLSAGLLGTVGIYSLERDVLDSFGHGIPLSLGLTALAVGCAVRLQAPFSGSIALLLLGAVTYREPGLMAAILVFLLAFQTRSRGASVLSGAALLIYGSLYYYNIDTSFLIKSATLVGSGLILLIARSTLRDTAVKDAF